MTKFSFIHSPLVAMFLNLESMHRLSVYLNGRILSCLYKNVTCRPVIYSPRKEVNGTSHDQLLWRWSTEDAPNADWHVVRYQCDNSDKGLAFISISVKVGRIHHKLIHFIPINKSHYLPSWRLLILLPSVHARWWFQAAVDTHLWGQLGLSDCVWEHSLLERNQSNKSQE